MKTVLQLSGLDCAACANELEELLGKIEGVISVSVSFVNQKISLEYEKGEALQKVIDSANHFEEVQVLETSNTSKLNANMKEGKRVLRIENLDCPVCAEALESDLSKIKGVKSVCVDYVTQTITVDADSPQIITQVIKKTNKFEQVRVLDGETYTPKTNRRIKEWFEIGTSAVFLAVGFLFGWLKLGLLGSVIEYCCYALAYIAVGYRVLIATSKNILKGRIFDENFLMTVASIGALFLGEYSEAVLVMLLYQVGEVLQSIAVGSSRNSVSELMELKSEHATVIENGVQKQCKPEELKVGDIVLIKTGDKIPADGVLLGEYAVLDTKSLTGESEPRQVEKGGELLSGCINVGGVYEMKVTRPYNESAVGKILDMVENAAAGKAAPEKFITKFARIYTPVVCCLALAIVLFAPLLNGLITESRLYFKDIPRWLQAALTFLVISCPCALIISVPLSYFSGIGTCAKNGILVKGAVYLDVVAKAKTVAFDKTGTLTEGLFTIANVYAVETGAETEILFLVAAVEQGSSHPLAKAFESIDSPYLAEDVFEIAGQGLKASVGGEEVIVGNEKLLSGNGIEIKSPQGVYTTIHVAKGRKYLGYVEIGDKLRIDAKDAVTALKQLKLDRCIMLTGDGEKRAVNIAKQVGMYEVKAELLPDGKLSAANELKKQGGLIYVGDGINDAPVMTVADCAVSMGTLGSAAAVEASDMVLISDSLIALPKAVQIARKTRKVVMQNIWFSILMKTAFMVLGLIGLLPLWLAVFADVGVMLLAVLNSFRVRTLR